MNSITEIFPEIGIWIHITSLSSTNLSITGKAHQTPTEIHLTKGWNMIGYPSLNENITLAEAFVGIPWDMIQICDQSRPYNLRYLPSTAPMKPGQGYWIHVTEDCVWVV